MAETYPEYIGGEPDEDAPAAPDMAALLAALQDAVTQATEPLRDELQAVRSELDAVRRGVPSYWDAEAPQGLTRSAPSLDLSQVAPDAPGDGGAQYPITSDGLAVSEHLQRRFPMRFRPGQAVRLRKDAVRGARVAEEEVLRKPNGGYLKTIRTLEPRTLGDILAERGERVCQARINAGGKRRIRCEGRFMVGEACPRCGNGPRILTQSFLGKRGAWKYRVLVPGLTTPRGDGFTEAELVPA